MDHTTTVKSAGTEYRLLPAHAALMGFMASFGDTAAHLQNRLQILQTLFTQGAHRQDGGMDIGRHDADAISMELLTLGYMVQLLIEQQRDQAG